MTMEDFSFGDDRLSDYGCMVAGINTQFSHSASMGSKLNLETIKNRVTGQNKIINTDYDEVVSATFDICKNPFRNSNSMDFSDGELSFFMRWLNKKNYEKFKPIYDDESYSDLYFYGSFNEIYAINISGKIVGLTVTFTSNAPFGYANEKEFNVSIDNADDSFIFYDDSDEVGYLYPSFYEITCMVSGNVKISNNMDTKSTVINNCIKNEVITMNCTNKIILSSKAHLTLFNDFNYNYPRFVNKMTERKNIFTVSLPCKIKIKYSPIRKAGIII